MTNRLTDKHTYVNVDTLLQLKTQNRIRWHFFCDSALEKINIGDSNDNTDKDLIIQLQVLAECYTNKE